MDHQQAIEMHAAERYLLNELAGAERDAFEEHYFSCTTCAEDVRTGARLQDGVRAGMAEVAPGSNVVPMTRHRRWQPTTVLPWAVAATLALVAGYQSLWVVPGLQQQVTTTAVTPVLLRPASRGAVPTVTVPATGVVALALDFNGAATGPSLTYDLRTVDGKSVASGAVAAPPAGTPLLLVVPVAYFSAPAEYWLLMRDTNGTAPPVAEYRFAVARP